MAKLYFKYGAMNSGKSTALIQIAHNYESRGQNIVLIKPSADTKDQAVLSRLQVRRDVDINATPDMNLYETIASSGTRVDCILVDEAQFLTPQQVDELFLLVVRMNTPVMCFGLRTDFKVKGFPGSTRLLELAHSIEEMKTICRCGSKALLNGRMVDGVFVQEGAQIAIDGSDSGKVEYESLCAVCYDKELDLFAQSSDD